MEVMAPDEAATIQGLVDAMRSINQKALDDSGHANHSVHAKAHALPKGEMRVRAGLPEPLAQGIFAAPRTYPVALRFSTNPGDILDDAISAPRGLEATRSEARALRPRRSSLREAAKAP